MTVTAPETKTKTVTLLTFEPSNVEEGGVGGIEWHADPQVIHAMFDRFAAEPDQADDNLGVYATEVPAGLDAEGVTDYLDDHYVSAWPPTSPERYRPGTHASHWDVVDATGTQVFHNPPAARTAYDAAVAAQAAAADAEPVEIVHYAFDRALGEVAPTLARTSAEQDVTITVPADAARLLLAALNELRASALEETDETWYTGDRRGDRAASMPGFLEATGDALLALEAALETTTRA